MIGRRVLIAYMIVLAIGILWIGYSTGISQRYLIWNLFLAFVPYGLAQILTVKPLKRWPKGTLMLAWLVFYPNAFYLVTDLIHLQNDVFYYANAKGNIEYVTSLLIWSRLLVLVSAVFIGLMLSYYSLNAIHEWLFKKQQGLGRSLAFHLAISCLTGFAVTLGRFFRFNSWDILVQPHYCLAIVRRLFSSPYWQLSLMFAFVHFWVLAFIWLMDQQENKVIKK